MLRKGSFDADAFYSALDGEKKARQLTWKKVAFESGVSASTLTRIAQGKRPDVDSLAALASWSGLEVDKFVNKGESRKEKPEPLAEVVTYFRSDPHLSEEAAIALEELVKAAYERLRKTERRT